MTQDEIKNLAASVHQRLLNKSKEAHRPFNELLQYHAIERFLYRLSRSPFADLFVLKGALMFQAWGIPGFRPTRDIDLLGYTVNAIEPVVEAFQKICALDVEPDGWIFSPESVQGERIKEDADYEGVRITFTAWLGKTRAYMQIDIGFGDVAVSVDVNYPAILNFPAPVLHGYSRETLIAEKFQAMVALGGANSRMKDFYDICVLSTRFDFDGLALQQAIEKTFRQRDTSLPVDVPVALTVDFAKRKTLLWDGFIRRMGLSQSEYSDFVGVVLTLQKFLLPPTQASAVGKEFWANWKKGDGWGVFG